MLTAYDDAEQAVHAFKAGALAYCPKDVMPQKLGRSDSPGCERALCRGRSII